MIDTGIGIPKEDHQKLFKLFGFVKDNKQLNVNGIGLGLVISKSICDQFNGDITFESELGKGSCFTFTFKLQKVEGMIQNPGEPEFVKRNTLFMDYSPSEVDDIISQNRAVITR